jgi:hypothetical protein
MNDLRAAAQQALEALEESEQHYGSDSALRDAIQILRAALEQPEQEPVAWWNPQYGTDSYAFSDAQADEWRVPLYTHPPRREWRGLTEEEMEDVWMRSPQSPSMRECLQTYARAIESKLKELNA